MRSCRLGLQLWILGLMICPCYLAVYAQTCPANIDFESGSFDGWTCYTGFVTGNGQNVITLTPSGGPVPEQQTMYTSFPGDGLDPYGGFPVNCPNGSGHSIRLGNNFGGGQAEGISYEFTIPANENFYNLIYHYAVVFQDPNHLEYQQPRMEIEVTNVTDNVIIDCSSFTFVPYGSILPGFFESPNPGSETPVWCKDWTAVSINLNNMAGKRIRMFFKTADCTFRRHFGYAYIDVNTECSGTFVGATYCPDDTHVNVVAPYGYQSYTWYNSTLTQVLGNSQIITFTPPPVSGTTIAVKLEPYPGYGCPVTLYAKMMDTLTVMARAGPDTISCNHNPVPIGTPPKPGMIYQWSPAAGLNDPNISNPHASPNATTTYVVTTMHDGGGCIDKDTVVVRAALIDNSLELLGKDNYCLGSGDSAVLRVHSADSIQWYRNDTAIPGAKQTVLRVTESGSYRAVLFIKEGCNSSTETRQITIASLPVAGISPASIANQCLVGNQFRFTNTSTNAVGEMQYQWLLGDGNTMNTRDVTYSFSQAGVYPIRMIVNSSAICADTSEFTITVYPNAVADFTAEGVCINLPMKANNLTMDTVRSPIHYLWNFGNGQTSIDRDPPVQVYPVAANYVVSLSVYTDQCPTPVHTLKRTLVVDKPRPAVTYPVQYAVIDYPLTLQARQFGATAEWKPGTFLNNTETYAPVFKGNRDQTYAIEITTASGCVTVDTQVVKTVKEAAIYVPTAFTPNNDGLNDRLKPTLMGIKQLKYFRVFNRWGQLLYQSTSENPGWDGSAGGIPQGSGAVVWMVEGIAITGNIIIKKGTCVLVR